MTGVTVTIGIPTYNRADGYLSEALSAALAQTYPNIEVIVADNCSTDDTQRVVTAIGGDRVTYIRHETNLGAQGNYNSLVERATGEYFLMLHDDDRIDADFVATCVAAMGELRPGLVRTGTRVIDGSGQVVYSRLNRAPGTTTKALLEAWFDTKTSFYFCSTLFNTAALRRTGGFATPKALFNDVAAYVLVADDAGTVEVRDVKATFRQHAGNSGKASTVAAWAHDAAHVVDLMTKTVSRGAAVPDKEFRAKATSYFCRNCYHRAARLLDPAARREAFAAVQAALDCTAAPWQYQMGRLRTRLGSRVKSLLK
ncbi:MAG TPA: glycosyltransferase family 2 protein [Trueperaceae bacterium]|nr:glycosyltransferase family 2 protein [Trueperaceae bacterium]